MRKPIGMFPAWTTKQSDLLPKVVRGYVYLEMRPAVWGLPQAGMAKEIDAILYLGCKFVPQLDGELTISCTKGTNESILVGLFSVLGCADSVVVRFNELKCYLLRGEVSLDCLGCLVVHHVDFRFESFAHKIFKVFCVCLQYLFQIETCDWGDEYPIGFVMVHNKETYDPVQGHIWEIPRTIIVYNAQYFVGERANAKYIGY